MKVPAWMLLGLILSILIMDISKVWMVRNRVITAVEQSLDAALVAGINVNDVRYGKSVIDEAAGYTYARSYFKANLKLNDNLENDLLKDTEYTLTFIQDDDRPKATIEVKTNIQAMSPKLVGLDAIPITIHKAQYHISKYN